MCVCVGVCRCVYLGGHAGNTPSKCLEDPFFFFQTAAVILSKIKVVCATEDD